MVAISPRAKQNHKLLRDWNAKYYGEYAVYLVTNKYGKYCLCCGSSKIELGHFTPPIDINNGFQTTYKNANSIGRVYDAENGLTFPICRSCNQSMGDSPRCRIHNKYLGVWTQLLKLQDLDNV